MNIKQIRLDTNHGLRTPGEEIAFTARPKIESQSKIYRCSQSIFCLPLLLNILCIFGDVLGWCGYLDYINISKYRTWNRRIKCWSMSVARLDPFRCLDAIAESHTARKIGDVKWRSLFRPLRSISENTTGNWNTRIMMFKVWMTD